MVSLGNTCQSKIVGIGDIYLQTDLGCSLVLKDVRYIADMHHNLISVLALDKLGYHNNFSNLKWKLSKGTLIVSRGKTCCTLYKTHAKACKSELNVVGDSSPDL